MKFSCNTSSKKQTKNHISTKIWEGDLRLRKKIVKFLDFGPRDSFKKNSVHGLMINVVRMGYLTVLVFVYLTMESWRKFSGKRCKNLRPLTYIVKTLYNTTVQTRLVMSVYIISQGYRIRPPLWRIARLPVSDVKICS